MDSIVKAARAIQPDAAPTDPRVELDTLYAEAELELRRRFERVFGAKDVKIERYTQEDWNANPEGTPIARVEGFAFKSAGANNAGLELLDKDRGGLLVNSIEDFAAYLPVEPVKPAKATTPDK